MANHPTYPGLTVEIIKDNDALQEYNSNEAEPDANEVCRYIQADSDTFFEVRYTIPKTLFAEHGVRAVIEIDGVTVRRNPYSNNSYRDTGLTVTLGKTSARVNGIDMGQRFHFTEIKRVETDQTVDAIPKEKIAELGQISVAFYAIENMRQKEVIDFTPDLGNSATVSEKNLKGLSLTHSARLVKRTPKSKSTWWDFDFVDLQCLPFATFRFKYRSLNALKSLDIVARTPSPTPLEDRPIEELSHNELTELVSRYRANEAEARNVKREKANTIKRELDFSHGFDDDDELTVVEERPRKRQYRPRKDDEIIVLD
ncbi:hypothetical protein E8E13_009136 [Curvularia kusanoi]|uniref:DUF7918 domain-containing protein n=1 Tax=Curvularia kusanoi TaxID=90978 RepID=A0A9P4WE49_CURKU|nr:hypothetical protein E8E13_009136 [Curvularia kusanoi]